MTVFDGSPLVAGDDGHRTSAPAFTAGIIRVGFSVTRCFAFLRIPNVDIPQAATINVAYITLTRIAGPAQAVNTDIYGIAEDNHVAPTSTATWDADHAIHTTGVPWDFTGAAGGTHQTPSLVPIVQELVDQPAWVGGNAMGFHIDDDGTSATRQDWANVEGGTNLPVLHAEYVSDVTAGMVVSLPGTVQISVVGLAITAEMG